MAGVALGTMAGGAALQVLLQEVANYYRRREGGDRRKVEEEVSSLRTALMELQILLINEEGRRDRSESEWMAELRKIAYDAEKIAYDAEDTLDEFATGVLKGKGRARPGSKLRSFVSHFLLKRKMSNVWSRLERIARKRTTLKALADGEKEDRVMGDNPSGVQQTGSLPTEPEMLGRDGEMDKILRWLLPAAVVDHAAAEGTGHLQAGPAGAGEDNSNYSVLVIVGMAGVGKTTLSQHIFHDKRVEDSFQVRAWVYAGNKLDVGWAGGIMKQILESSGKAEGFATATLTSLDGMERKLKDLVEEKQFLLVLDDVGDVDQMVWKNLEAPLRYCKKGSRVLVTSQNKEVAGKMSTQPALFLTKLTFDVCWSLFRKYAFVNEGNFVAPPAIEEIAKQIARRLDGLPLAAVTLGSQLKRLKPDAETWRKILESELWDVAGILPSLLVSYQNLPHHLKRCLLYCSILARDTVFEGTTLVQHWMAQGFVLQSEEDKSLEEIGRDYVDDLVDRSFFHPWGDDTYRMHGLIHDLVRHIVKNHCMWADRISSSRSQVGDQDVRHISYFFGDPFWEKLESCRSKKLRTLLSLENPKHGETPPQTHVPLELFGTWRCLRVLSLSLCLIQALPESIRSLIHLRYMNISFTSVRKLPKALTRLYNLQTLILSRNPELKQLPRDMNMLANLRHLEAEAELLSGIAGIGKLRLLQKLEGYRVSREKGHAIAELGEMADLRVLSVCRLDNVENETEASEAKLENKRHLHSLTLQWGGDGDGDVSDLRTEDRVLEGLRPHSNLKQLTVAGYGSINFPSWMEGSHLRYLETLHLQKCGGWEALPPMVGQLSFLTSLTMEDMTGMRRIESLMGGGGGGGDDCAVMFTGLESLQIRQMPALEEWHGSEQCRWFPRLRVLTINGCPKLRRLPPLPLELTQLILSNVGLDALPVLWLPPINADIGPSNSMNASLQSLSISWCPNLVSLHEGLMASRRLAALRFLHIDHCAELVVPPGGASADFASLESLTIEECPRLILPEGYPLLSLLKHVRIIPCSASLIDSVLIGLSNMTALREFHLRHENTQLASFTDKHFYVEACGGISSIVLRSCLSLRGMSSISELEIGSCPRVDSISGEALRGLTALRKLVISRCRGLVSVGIPVLVHLETLKLEDCPELMSLTSTSSATRDVTEYLRSLTELYITACPKLRSLGDEVLRRMSKLNKVEITDCTDLMSVSLHLLTSLTELEITGCPKLNDPNRAVLPAMQSRKLLPLEYLSAEGAGLLTHCLRLSNPTSLRQLWVTERQGLVSFPTELESALEDLSSLEVLAFARCSDLQSLPSELHSLPSLKELRIWYCPKVESPQDTRLPDSCSLSIIGCPALETQQITEE